MKEVYDNRTVVPTIDLTTGNDGKVHTYRVREYGRFSSSCTVTATSREEAKEKACKLGLRGKLIADVL